MRPYRLISCELLTAVFQLSGSWKLTDLFYIPFMWNELHSNAVAIWKLIPTTEVPSEEVAHGVWCDEITWLIIVSISLEYVQTYSAMTVKYAQCLFCKYSAEYHVL